jgi:O-antigen/teichoic acid export membrane protein
VNEDAPATNAVSEGVEAGRGALFIGFAKIYFMFGGFLQSVGLAHLVDAAGFGAFGVVNNLISIVNNGVVQSTIPAISKFTAEDNRHADAVKRAGLRMQFVLGGVVALAFFLGAPLIASWVKAPAYVRYFRIAAAIPFLYALYSLFVGSANGLRRFRTQATFDVTFSTAKTILLLGMAFLWHVTGAFVGFVLAAVVILLVAARVMGVPSARAHGSEPVFSAWRLVSFMGAMVVYTLLLNVSLNYDQPLLLPLAKTVVDSHRAEILAGHYDGLRKLALLPYQALLVITFVAFPLISRSTFTNDRDATRTYVSQTLRYALILVGALGICLAARPDTLLGIIFPRDYGEGATALAVLVLGECCLAMLAVSCAILNAAGRARASITLISVTVAVEVGASCILVPHAAAGSEMLLAAATATAAGTAVGFLGAIVYLRRALGGGLPAASAVRVAFSVGIAVAAGHFLPAHGKFLGLVAIAAVALVYVLGLLATGELGPADRAKLLRILRRR